MGYYHEEPGPDHDSSSRAGCLDVLVITRVVFQVLFWPMALLFLVVLDVAAAMYLFAYHPALALIPVGVTAVAVWLLARWDQRRARPPLEPPSGGGF